MERFNVYEGVIEGLREAPVSINADMMSADKIRAKIQEGYEDALSGNLYDASAAFRNFRETHAQKSNRK